VVGDAAAARSAAVSFRDGRLLVEVVNSVWIDRLSSSRQQHLAELNKEIGSRVVREIIYRLNPRLPAHPPAGRTRDAEQPNNEQLSEGG
jgi:hypothetical protein